jgi:hypothetical protein
LIRVTGQLVLAGGPSAASTPIEVAGSIEVLTLDGMTTTIAKTDDTGRFEFSVLPGLYQLVGRTPKYQSGDVACLWSESLSAVDTDVSGVLIACQMK